MLRLLGPACAVLVSVTATFAQEKAVGPRSLADVLEGKRSLTIYLAELPSSAITDPVQTDNAHVHAPPVVEFFGAEPYLGTSMHHPEPVVVKVYRVLGTSRDNLDCDSTILVPIAEHLTKPAGEECGQSIRKTRILAGADVPFVEIKTGSSLALRMLSPGETKGTRRRLTLSNHAKIDLWVEWSNDVHQGPHLDKLFHGSTKERESRKVPEYEQAIFHIKVFKNAGGEPGKYLGEFNAPVWVHDHVEFIVVTISGKTYFQAVSAEQVGKILLEVLL